METIGFFAIAAVVVILIVNVLLNDDEINKSSRSEGRRPPTFFETWFAPEQKRAGMRGEAIASKAILSVMRDEDRLYNNVNIRYDGRPTELDNVIVNRYGVFIIEVKNYSGVVYGDEDDYEWQKRKETRAGNVYVKTVKNPIKQVKRQSYLLARYLEERGVKIWVKGYAILLQNNSPVASEYILTGLPDIDRAVHTPGRKILSPEELDNICQAIVPNHY